MRLEPVKNWVFDFIGRNVDPSRWCYHSRIHTRWVLEDVTLFATRSKVGEAELLRLQVAALFHDTGYSRGGGNHEAASAAIAVTVLPRFGFPKEELNRIAALILATEFPPRETFRRSCCAMRIWGATAPTIFRRPPHCCAKSWRREAGR